MSIQHQSLTETKTVIKPWGQEKWIQQGQDNHSYVLKEIILNEGFKTSLQVHKYKAETNYILEGQGRLIYSDIAFRIDLPLFLSFLDLLFSFLCIWLLRCLCVILLCFQYIYVCLSCFSS